MVYRKKLRLYRALAINRLRPSTPFIRILPTDYCNLKCSYCWQHTKDRHAMSYDLFQGCFDKAMDLDVGLVSFLGGEPTLWPFLLDAIADCDKKSVCTDLTTNGMSLDPDSLESLADAGLDLLNISVDGLEKSRLSKKCALSKPGLLDAIREVQLHRGLRVRMNSVLCKNNWLEIQQLIDISQKYDIPISLGYAMHENETDFDPNIHFGMDDKSQILAITSYLNQARQRGVKIIDPQAYFIGYHRFLKRDSFWLCNYATRRGWINIDPHGYVRDCTKKMNRIPVFFPHLEYSEIPSIRATLAAGVATCNQDCYSKI